LTIQYPTLESDENAKETRVTALPFCSANPGHDISLLPMSYMCKYKCIELFVERRLQDDQRPFTRAPGYWTSYMRNTVSLWYTIVCLLSSVHVQFRSWSRWVEWYIHVWV